MNAFTILAFSLTSTAQSFTCSDFSITGISPNPPDSTSYQVTVQFSAPSTVFVNYPQITALLDCHGDTVAKGASFFFGQFGQTTFDYPVTKSGSLACQPLTAVFAYVDDSFQNDTCLLTFGMPTGLVNTMKTADAFSVYPNPAQNHVTIQGGIIQTGDHYLVHDHTGKLILTGEITSEQTRVDLSHLSPGIYLFRLREHPNEFIKVIKQ